MHNDCEKELTVKLFPRAKEPPNVINPKWVTVEPEVATLGAQETVYFHVSVSIPEETDAGFYDGMIVIQADDGPEQIKLNIRYCKRVKYEVRPRLDFCSEEVIKNSRKESLTAP